MQNIEDLYRSQPLGRSERETYFRLMTLLPGSGDDPIHCQIEKHALFRCPRYEALSYCWGDAGEGHEIQCNGYAKLKVTTNLHAALKQLRDAGAVRVLWIDAICINQGDVAEREQQVPLMGNIYTWAERVIAWLGPAADHSEIVFPLLERLRKTPASQSVDATQVETEAFAAMMSRPWRRRVWIVQEFCLARSVTFMCGADSMESGALEILCDDPWCMSSYFETCGTISLVINLLGLFGLLLLRRAVQHQLNQKAITQKVILLQHTMPEIKAPCILLLLFQHFNATRQLDKVYGLLGLLDLIFDFGTTTNQPLVIPNYTIPPEECYLQVAAGLVSRGHHISLEDVLYAAAATRTIKRQQPLQVPSWVLDWSDVARGPMSNLYLYYNGTGHIQDNFFDVSRLNQRGFPSPRVKIQDDKNEVLSLYGIDVDGICRLTTEALEFGGPFRDEASTDKAFGEVKKAIRFKISGQRRGRGCCRVHWHCRPRRTLLWPWMRQAGRLADTVFGWEAMAVGALRQSGAHRAKGDARAVFLDTVTMADSGHPTT